MFLQNFFKKHKHFTAQAIKLRMLNLLRRGGAQRYLKFVFMTLFAYFEVLKDELLYRQNVTSKTYCHLKAQLSKQGLERRVLNKFTLPILKYNCNQSTRLKEAISNFYVCTKHNELEFSSNFLRKLNEKNYVSHNPPSYCNLPFYAPFSFQPHNWFD